MKNTVKINSVDLINADCLHFIQSLPDDSIDLIVTDPPYFKVKPNGWDNQWKGDEDYLKWLDHCLAQFWRVLKPAGSLYLFCGHRLASDIEIMMRERFNVLNHIIWAKPSGRWNGCNKESLRAYFPATERVLFAEHYQGPYRGKSDGYAAKERELKQHIMAPLISYFRDARAELGITAKQIAEATGKKNMVSHWFGASQWQLRQRDVAALDAKYTKELADAKAENDALRDDVAAGRRRLHIKAVCQSVREATTASGVDNAASPRLADTAERDYFTLRERLITMQKQLEGTQKYINEQCR
ncbi:hypothetical protein VEE12_35050 [Escherichia coli]|nr:hypothetical protein VEE12_35050 [Escherichia coli]